MTKKVRYKENLFCKAFYDSFNMMDIIQHISYEKVDHASKRHITYKFKSGSCPKKTEVCKELEEAVSLIIERNHQYILDRLQKEEPKLKSVDMTTKRLVDKIFDVSKTEQGNAIYISINMEM